MEETNRKRKLDESEMTYKATDNSASIEVDFGYNDCNRNPRKSLTNGAEQTHWNKERSSFGNFANNNGIYMQTNFPSSSDSFGYGNISNNSEFEGHLPISSNGNTSLSPRYSRDDNRIAAERNINLNYQQLMNDAINVSWNTVNPTSSINNITLSTFKNPMMVGDSKTSTTFGSTSDEISAASSLNVPNRLNLNISQSMAGNLNTSELPLSGQTGLAQLWRPFRNGMDFMRSNETSTKRTEGVIRGISNTPIAKRQKQIQLNHDCDIDQSMPSVSKIWMHVNGRAYALYHECDEGNLSQYQCLARKQMEIFEATTVDASNNAQGRNKPILPGQIGIRCKHCYKLAPKQRKTGSVYYPNKLEGVYQTAQKMTVGHLLKHCTMIPPDVREHLAFLKDQKSSDGGGKKYWANRVRMLGVIETPYDGLAFEKSSTHLPQQKNLEGNMSNNQTNRSGTNSGGNGDIL